MNIRRTRRVLFLLSHVLVDGKIVTTGGAELVEEINNNGFDRFVKGE